VKKTVALWMGMDIQTTSGPCLQPHRLQYWDENAFKSQNPEEPFHFKADALTALSFLQLSRLRQNPFQPPHIDFHFATTSWLAIEPHHEMFVRCQPRVASLRKQLSPRSHQATVHFEHQLTEILESSQTPRGFNLDVLTDLISAVDSMETKSGHALLYNFQVQFSKETIRTLHHLHSLLFNLRVLIAMDHNAYIQDPTYESVQVDSISDYLPKADYVGNDALLYWQFSQMKSQIPESSWNQMQKSFHQLSHNATCLIENLPQSFLKALPKDSREDSLYLLQMDWLLGTEAGLLFRVREELYGLLDGYEKVFWPQLEGKPHQPAHQLLINCRLEEKHLFPTQEAA